MKNHIKTLFLLLLSYSTAFSSPITPALYKSLKSADKVVSLSFSPNSKYVAVGCKNGELIKWDFLSSKSEKLVIHKGNINRISFSHDGSLLATAGSDGTVNLIDFNTFQVIETFKPEAFAMKEKVKTYEVVALTFAPDGNSIYFGGATCEIFRAEAVKNGRIESVYESKETIIGNNGKSISRYFKITDIKISNDRASLIFNAGNVKVLRLKDLKIMDSFPINLKNFSTLALNKNNGLSVWTNDGNLLYWNDYQNEKENYITIPAGEGYNPEISFLRNKYIISGANNSDALIWDLNEREVSNLKLIGHERLVSTTAVCPRNRFIATGSHDNTVNIWSTNMLLNSFEVDDHEQKKNKLRREILSLKNEINELSSRIDKYSNSSKSFIISDITFKQATTEIRKGKKSIKILSDFLKNNEHIKITIVGNSDVIGPERENQILSQERADYIKEILVSKGIEKERLSTIGYGGMFPIYSKPSTSEEHNMNRRVEIVFSSDY